MKKILLVGMICLMGLATFAQQRENDQIEAMKISFITKQVDLSPEQAQQFWPIYNQMADELKVLRTDKTGITERSFDELTDKEVEGNINAKLDKEQKLLDIKKKYINKYKAVLSIKQVAKLIRAEEQFKRRLLAHISNRKNQDRKK